MSTIEVQWINREVIETLRGLGEKTGKNIVGQLITLYVDSTPKALTDIQEKLDQGAMEEVAQIAHSLKSSSGNVGAEQMSEISASIEEAICDSEDENVDVSSVKGMVAELVKIYEPTSVELKSLGSVA